MKTYSLLELRDLRVEDLEALPTISSSQFDDLKIDTGEIRVWLSRMTEEDGHKGSRISYEKFYRGRWYGAMFFGNILTRYY